jgi:hypothetical protein
MADKHFDLDYAIVRATKQHARGTGTKVARLDLSEDGTPTGKVTLRNGRGENKGSFTVSAEGVKIHKAPVKKAKKEAAPEADASE